MASKKAAVTDETRSERLLMKAEVYLSHKLLRQAELAIGELLEISPEQLEVHELRRRLHALRGDRDGEARALVRIAALLAANRPEEANLRLRDAQQLASSDSYLRDAAARYGLELDEFLRVPVVRKQPRPIPEEWPWAPDQFSDEAWLFRLSSEGALVDTRGREQDDVELGWRLGLEANRLSDRSIGNRVIFVGSEVSFVAFAGDDFIAVHQIAPQRLGAIAGRIQREEPEPEDT